MDNNNSDRTRLDELLRKYRNGEISEKELTEEQIVSLGHLYDKKIREQKASNRSRLQAINAWLETHSSDDDTVSQIRDKISDTPLSSEGKSLTSYYLKDNPTGTGLDLFDGLNYLATYQSYEECISDMSFHLSIFDFDTLINMFARKDISIRAPYRYRAVCSELFCPLEKVFRYVYYGDSLTSILERVEYIEKRSITYPDYFVFGIQGIAIHLFDESDLKYKFWLGGNEFRCVSDVIKAAHDENKFVPNELIAELTELNRVDVFISHKSEDFVKAKRVYDYLVSNGIPTFLSEMSLPALSNADYSAEIDKALEKASNIVVIATCKENVLSGWVQYEWSAFANEKRSGRKTGNIITLIDDKMPITDLPILLRQFEVIPLEQLEAVNGFLRM